MSSTNQLLYFIVTNTPPSLLLYAEALDAHAQERYIISTRVLGFCRKLVIERSTIDIVWNEQVQHYLMFSPRSRKLRPMKHSIY